MTIRTLLKKHAVLTYYILTYAISWGGLAIAAGPGGVTPERSGVPFVLVYFITVAGPPIASVILSGLFYGRAGLRKLFSGLLKWRVGVRWYAVALLAAPLSVMATLFALSITSPAFVPGIFAAGSNSFLLLGFQRGDKAALLLVALLVGIGNGFLEELGWTGFVIPKLIPRYRVLGAGLIAGSLWGAWHFLANYMGVAVSAEGLSLFLYLPVLLFSFLLPYRMLMAYVCNRTGSLLLAVLMHASLDMFWLLSTPLAITGVQRVIWYLAWAAVLWVAVAIAALIGRRQPNRNKMKK